jgi:PAS domain S-box-containing protein
VEFRCSVSSAFDHISEGVWSFGSDGRTTFVNERMANMLGYERGELLACPLWDFLDERSRARALADGALPEAEVPPRVVIGLVRKDGSILQALTSTSVVEDGGPGSGGATARVVDIEETVERERRSNQRLKEVQEESQAKAKFLSIVSHEIRSPLAAVIGFAELLASGRVTEKDRQHYLDIIIRNGRFLARLVDDILDIGKIDAGKFQFDHSQFSLRDLVKDACHLFVQRAKENDVVLDVKYEASVPQVIFSDRFRVQQVLVNLIGNAVKFTEHGKVQISVSLWKKDAQATQEVGAESVCISIKDTGTGISREDAHLLFQDYYQLDPKSSRSYGGTGLGLALSRRLARGLGGDVWLAESEPGRGSTFCIRLPIRAVNENQH